MTPFKHHFPLGWGRECGSNQSEEATQPCPTAPQGLHRIIALMIKFKGWIKEASSLYKSVLTVIYVCPLCVGSGSCRFSYSDPSITVSYSLSGVANTSDDWITLEKIRFLSCSFFLIPIPQSFHLLWSSTLYFFPSFSPTPLNLSFLSWLCLREPRFPSLYTCLLVFSSVSPLEQRHNVMMLSSNYII